MRPLRRKPGSSRTTILPIRKRAKATVSAGNSERRRRRTGAGGWRSVWAGNWQQSSEAARKSNLTPDQAGAKLCLGTLERNPMEPDKSDKRRLVRKRTDQLLYAEFGPDNGSILLNLSEEGCSFQSLAPVRGDQVRFSVSVGDGHKLEGDGQMVWSDTGKKTGGVRFLNPSHELRKQVRTWLDQALVTTEGKLDPAAVESEAKRRRKKLREDAKAEAERAQREGALQNRVEAPGEGSRPAPQVRPASDPITDATPNPIALDDSSTRTPH